MRLIRPILAGTLATTLLASGVRAAQDPVDPRAAARPGPPAAADPQAKPTQKPPPPPPPPATDPTRDVNYRETVVVSASKTEQQLVDAPATITVIGPRALSVAPSNNYADILRSVPGVNITQISARDINIVSRGASSSLATSQLAVVDGRSIYQDFFGFTMYDFMPSNLEEIKRIEIIRGPASAVWGANALNGVVNVITKTPREMAGTYATIGLGTFNRDVPGREMDHGSLFYVQGVHAQAVNDRVAYKVSAGVYDSDAFARPAGLVPNGGSTPYPPYTNTGTRQPKVDARVDYEFPDGQRRLELSGGVAGTDGIMHTGLGPFDIDRGTTLGYWKANFTRGPFRLQAFMNVLDGTAGNLVSVDQTGSLLGLNFETKTFDVELGDTRIAGGRHVLTYGGNLRINRFSLTVAPGEDGRTEGGAYVQDEFLMHDRVRLVAGGRVDKFSSIDGAVFSPRLAVVLKPRPDQSVRVSYNRAFRAPSMVNNNLEAVIGTAIPLGAINPLLGDAVFYVPSFATGNRDLKEEKIDAVEVAFTGNLRDRATLSAAWYYTKFSDQIYFTNTIGGVPQIYGAATPPPGWPLGPLVWGFLVAQQGVVIPSRFTYLNLGEVESTGIELGIDGAVTDTFSAFANYSFQADPDPTFPGLTETQALAEINVPAKHLFNLGASYVSDRLFGTFSVTRTTRAFWQDVLDARFSGFTPPYTSVNLTAGMKFAGGRYAAALKVTNLTNETIQQHIFGDIVKRQIAGEFKLLLR
jgi:iron complex outermembrane receptor protein